MAADVQALRYSQVNSAGQPGDQPLPSSKTFFNILAARVVQDQPSPGATWMTSSRGHSIFPGDGGGSTKPHLQADLIGVSYG